MKIKDSHGLSLNMPVHVNNVFKTSSTKESLLEDHKIT